MCSSTQYLADDSPIVIEEMLGKSHFRLPSKKFSIGRGRSEKYDREWADRYYIKPEYKALMIVDQYAKLSKVRS